MANWPLCYRVLTVRANPEVARYQERQGAIIHRRQVMHWLDLLAREAELLVTPPERSFVIEEIRSDARRPALAL